MRRLSLFALLLLTYLTAYAGWIQNEDVKSSAEVISDGGTTSQILNTSKMWDNINGVLLNTDITNFWPSQTGNSGKFLTTNGTTASWATTGSGNAITQLTGDVTAIGPGSTTATLATVNSNVGSFGSQSQISTFTVNGKGLVTAAGNTTITAPAGSLTGTTLASNVVSSSLTAIGTISSGTWNGSVIVPVYGGSGLNSNVAYELLAGGTVANGNFQQVSGVGSSGQVLTSNGPSALPTWQNNSGGSAITQLTGDVTAIGPGSTTATLATVNSNTGSWGSQSMIPTFTVNGKGLVTAAGNTTITAPAGSLTGSTLASNVTGSSLTSVGTISSGTWNGSDITVPYGGTGLPALTAYSLLAGGTTSTSSVQQIAAGATTGQVLTYQGPSALPAWQSISAIGISTDWTAYTPTLSGWGTVSSQSFVWRRVGDSLQVQGYWVNGTVAATLATIPLPVVNGSQLNIDTTKITNSNTTSNPGTSVGLLHQAEANGDLAVVTATGTSTSQVYVGNTANSSNLLTPQNGNGNSTSSAASSIWFTVPIVGWSSNTIGASQGAVYANYHMSTNTATNSGVQINFDTKDQDSGCATGTCLVTAAAAGTSGTWKFTASVQGSHHVMACSYTSSTGYDMVLYYNGAAYKGLSYVATGGDYYCGGTDINLIPGDYIDLRPDANTTVRGGSSPQGTFISVVLNSGNSAAAQPRCQSTYDSGNGAGSTNTKVRRWTNARVASGSCYTYADSATLGGSWTINTQGIYTACYDDTNSSGGTQIAIVVNGSAGTTNPASLTYAQGLRMQGNTGVSGVTQHVCWTGLLNVNDVVWAQEDGSANSTTATSMFTLTQVSN
jgi:hypothetical protein